VTGGRYKEDGFALQEDNVAIEYNVPPTNSLNQFIGYNNHMHKLIQSRLHKMHKYWTISEKASESFEDEQLDEPNAWIFGCEPDYNAYTLSPNPRPKCSDPNFRSCGGHIHIGYNFKSKMDVVQMVKALDATVGIYLTTVDPDKNRSQLYGKAGSFRFKPYGFEYRTPSNFWAFDSKRMEHVLRYTNAAFTLAKYNSSLVKEVPDIINAGDVDAAKGCLYAY
ncbi:MAG: putative amidoligase domain-containing protein, partial [Turicibacter sp.]